MTLKSVRVQEFQSVWDSSEFSVSDVTCLVGKNEAGKTALLQALYRLNPLVASEGEFSVTHDYPRREVADYEHEVESEERDPALVITAVFELSKEDIEAVEAKIGKGVLKGTQLELSKGYENDMIYELEVDEKRAIKNVLGADTLLPELKASVLDSDSPTAALGKLEAAEQTEAVQAVVGRMKTVTAAGGTESYIFEKILKARVPKFLYFDEYYQMDGRANIEALQKRIKDGTPAKSDHPLVGLVHLARLEIDDLTKADETRELKNRLEGASNQLTKAVVKYWSQNRHLGLRFDVRPAMANDPPGMTSGTNIWGEVYDSRHLVTTELRSRSRGFVWFFSFLAWYSDVKRRKESVILLLDEPGLSLHAKAQEDLLRYFDAEIVGNHQLIYTTHSPFLVDPTRFDRVRIVQDLGVDTDDKLPADKEGTKVLADVLDATGDSLFPLQGALGYEIYQTLFIGPHCLVVEGVSDLLYLQGISAVLEINGKTPLNTHWTITPVGGSTKVPTFVALIGAQRGLNVAVLVDIQKKDAQLIENLYKRKLLKKNKVLTFGDFTTSAEADIEDMFGEDFYLKLVNLEYKKELKAPIKATDLNPKLPRVVLRIEEYFAKNSIGSFSHFRPARYFSENVAGLAASLPKDATERLDKMVTQVNSLLK